jgi:hypothetical protein
VTSCGMRRSQADHNGYSLVATKANARRRSPRSTTLQPSGQGRGRTADLPLFRSFHGRRPPAVPLVGVGLLAVWILLDVPGFRLVLARGWHGARPPMRTVGWVLLMFCAPSVTSVLAVRRSRCRRAGLQYVAAVWVPALGLACMPVAQLDPAHGARLFKCDRSCWKSGLRSARFTNAHHRRPSGPPPQKMAADPVRCVSQAMPVRTAALLRHISIMHLLSDSRISQEASGFCRAGSVKWRRSRSRRDAVGALDRFRETPIIPSGGLGSALLPKQ